MNIPPNAVFVYLEVDAGTTIAWRTAAAASLDHCFRNAFRQAWGKQYTARAGADGETLASLKPGEVGVQLQASSDVQGAAGYHDDGQIHVFRDGLSDDELSMCASHESFEAGVDPGACVWSDNGQGEEVAYETCDAVESFSFVPPGCTAPISDFVLPSFFDPSGVAPFSHTGAATAPFTTASANGTDYQIVRSVDENGAQQVTADLARHPRKKAKAHPSSRTARRLRSSRSV
jgi:hypothetical protein